MGTADPRHDQNADEQADHDDHQHAHARRSRQRERRVPGDGRGDHAGEHQGEHGEDAHFQGAQRRRTPEADVHGQDEDRQGRRRDRSLLLRSRTYQRRRDRRVPRAPRRAHRRFVRGQDAAARGSRQRRKRAALSRDAEQSARGNQERRDHHQRPQQHDDDVGRPEAVRRLQPGVAGLGAGRTQIGENGAADRRRRVERPVEVRGLPDDGREPEDAAGEPAAVRRIARQRRESGERDEVAQVLGLLGGTMNARTLTLGALIAAGAVSLAAFQQPAQPDGPKVVEAQKIQDHLWMLTGQGGGGNTAVFVGTDAVVVVDAKNPGWGRPILDKIKELTPKPVTLLINTHTHGDHVSGNVEFPATVDIVVQENTKANMEKMDIFKQNNGRGMAKQTFKDKMTIGNGTDQVDLYFFGRGHTNGDAFVVFPRLRAMHAGDIFSGKNLPLLDYNNGGSGAEIGSTLAKAHAGIKNVDTIITGHSTTMTWADLGEYAQFNRDFLTSVQMAMKTGKTADDAAAAWKINDKYKGYTIAEPRLKQNITAIYAELKK